VRRPAAQEHPGRCERIARCSPLLLLGLAACAQFDVQPLPREDHHRVSPVAATARQQREAEMNRQWQNKPLAELLATLGMPQMTMSIPGGGMPPGFAVVYGRDPASGCIDAFAVSATDQPVVRIYHCR
jgi:hypothetical protein